MRNRNRHLTTIIANNPVGPREVIASTLGVTIIDKRNVKATANATSRYVLPATMNLHMMNRHLTRTVIMPLPLLPKVAAITLAVPKINKLSVMATAKPMRSCTMIPLQRPPYMRYHHHQKKTMSQIPTLMLVYHTREKIIISVRSIFHHK